MKLPVVISNLTIIAQSHGRGLGIKNFQYPDGRIEEFSRWFIAHPNPVIVFPVTHDGQILYTNQYRHAAERLINEVPGGNPKADQSCEELIREELEQETGSTPETIIRLTPEPYVEPSSLESKLRMFVALGCTITGQPKPERNEVIELKRVSLQEWYSKIFAGELLDSKTLALSLLALPVLKEHLGFVPKY